MKISKVFTKSFFMASFLLTNLLAVNSVVSANESQPVFDFDKTFDGGIVKCESLEDYNFHLLRGVYKPIALTKSLNGSDFLLEIEFQSCSDLGKTFRFVKDLTFEKKTVTLKNDSPAAGKNRQVKVTLTRKNFRVIAFTQKGKLLLKSPLIKSLEGNFLANLKLSTLKIQTLDTNSSGENFLDLSVQYDYELVNSETGTIIDSGIQSLSAFRLTL
jgi:hypothetical protein